MNLSVRCTGGGGRADEESVRKRSFQMAYLSKEGVEVDREKPYQDQVVHVYGVIREGKGSKLTQTQGKEGG